MKRWTLLLSAVLLLLLPLAASAASELDQLRADGVVGERYDGLAIVRSGSAGASVRETVDSVNAKRLEIYEARAAKQGAPVEEVGKVYALQIAEKAPAGTWFLGEDGKWVQKKR